MSKNVDFDIAEFLPYLLNQAAEQCSLDFQSYYKEKYGMLRTEWRVVFHLGKYGLMTARDVSLKAKTHKTKISRAVHELERKDFLVRETDPNDRRQERLSLTTRGKKVYDDLQRAARDYDRTITDTFKDSEVALLRKMLKSLIDPA
ncbi:MAG: MarR family winged helix-turn-helix transcriptional regulator [Stappiaceae bacterium]